MDTKSEKNSWTLNQHKSQILLIKRAQNGTLLERLWLQAASNRLSDIQPIFPGNESKNNPGHNGAKLFFSDSFEISHNFNISWYSLAIILLLSSEMVAMKL